MLTVIICGHVFQLTTSAGSLESKEYKMAMLVSNRHQLRQVFTNFILPLKDEVIGYIYLGSVPDNYIHRSKSAVSGGNAIGKGEI